jgi:rare lipoprotein A
VTSPREIIAAPVFLAVFWLLQSDALASPPERFTGLASVYSADYSSKTANGEQYNPHEFTAAHRSLPLGTLVKVTAAYNHRSVTVVINDRGPFVPSRVLDLSRAAGKALGILDRGVVMVTAVVQHPRAIHLHDLFSDETPLAGEAFRESRSR